MLGLAMTGDEIDPLAKTSASEGAALDDTDVATGAGDGAVTPDQGLENKRLRASVKAKLFGDDGEELRIGRFRVIDKIGEGGMGVVYLAFDDELDRRVALKLLRPGGSGDVSRLQREAKAMAKLSHPNIAAVFDVGTHEDSIYVAMEYVDGVSLREWLEEDRPWSEVLDVVGQAAAGLTAAHDEGLVHRDFKPDNVLIGLKGESIDRVRVLDFGLAKTTELPEPEAVATEEDLPVHLTQTGAVLGTPRFMAPEQFQGESVSPATDQFALCVSLYRAAYRQWPFEGETVAELALAVTSGEPKEPPEVEGVPPEVWPVLRRGLRAAADQRHQSVTAVMQELEGAKAQSEPEPAPQPAPKPSRTLWMVVGGLFAVGLVAGTVQGLSDDDEPPLAVAPQTAQPEGPRTGQLSIDSIEATMKAHVGDVQACSDEANERAPWLHGRISVHFWVAENGRTRDVEANQVALFGRNGEASDETKLPACFVEMIKQVEFPKPQGGPVEINWPFVLSPPTRDEVLEDKAVLDLVARSGVDLGPIPEGCPEGTEASGDDGCRPTGTCSALVRKTACLQGNVACCVRESIPLEFELLEANKEGNARVAESLKDDLAEIWHQACRLGHAASCRSRAGLLEGTPAAAAYTDRACKLGLKSEC